MIHIYYGDDREAALKQAEVVLGRAMRNGTSKSAAGGALGGAVGSGEWEVIDGEELATTDLPSIFLGVTLFATRRRILVKDLSMELLTKLPEYVGTTHEVVIVVAKIDKRSAEGKAVAGGFGGAVEVREFKMKPQLDRSLAFNIYDMVFLDRAKAVKMLAQAEESGADPYMMVGAWAWKAIDKFQKAPRRREEAALKKLAELDMQLKSGAFSAKPWLLLRAFLWQV